MTAPAPDEAGSQAASALPQVVVTADRSPVLLDKVGQSVTLLTKTDLINDQELDVADILARTPGVTVARNGGPGELTSVYIRGAESAQTVVLIDGVKVNDPTDPSTGYDFSTLLTGDASRIEVLRGPQSTLYGSEAIGGVVNVVTAAAQTPLEGEAQIEGGSFGTGLAKGAVGGKEQGFDWRVGAYYEASDGIPAFDQALGGHVNRGFDTAGVSGRFDDDLTSYLTLDQRIYYTASRNEFDGYDTPSGAFGDDAEFGRTQELVDYTGLNLSLLGGRLTNRFSVEYSAVGHQDEDPGESIAKYTFLASGRTVTWEYEGAYAIAPGYNAVFGAQTERSTLATSSPYDQILYGTPPASGAADISSLYGQISGEPLAGLTLTGGVRYDDHSTFGGHVDGQASLAWRLNNGDTILRASFGQGFKAPSLYQLYSEYGNSNLRPETASGWDAGVEQHLFGGRVSIQATYFGRVTHDLIDFVSCYGVTSGPCLGNTVGGYYDNVDRTEAEGVEVAAVWRPAAGVEVLANYTYDDDVDRSPGAPTYGLQLNRRPRNAANLDASYVWPVRLRTEIAVRYAGQSYDDDADTIPLKGYTLVDLRASYPLRPNLSLYGRVENATNTHYETTYEYGTPGRAGYAGLRLTF